jgi:hypothetical protein
MLENININFTGKDIKISEDKINNNIISTTYLRRTSFGRRGTITTSFFIKINPFVGMNGLNNKIGLDGITTYIDNKDKEIPDRHIKKVNKLIESKIQEWEKEIKYIKEKENVKAD